MLKKANYTKTETASKVKREVVIIDAKDQVLGRVASKVAYYLQGKNKANFVANIDMGDFVIVLNVGSYSLSGRKITSKVYKRYSGYQGGLREESFDETVLKKPAFPLLNAVKGMLPDNKLKKERMNRLFTFMAADYSKAPKEVLEILKTENGK